VQLRCRAVPSRGNAPVNREKVANQFVANIMDDVPMANIMPFGMCVSLASQTTAAATSAAMGVLTPTPAYRSFPHRGHQGRRRW
jgi:Domain of unknown function (DUF4280)